MCVTVSASAPRVPFERDRGAIACCWWIRMKHRHKSPNHTVPWCSSTSLGEAKTTPQQQKLDLPIWSHETEGSRTAPPQKSVVWQHGQHNVYAVIRMATLHKRATARANRIWEPHRNRGIHRNEVVTRRQGLPSTDDESLGEKVANGMNELKNGDPQPLHLKR